MPVTLIAGSGAAGERNFIFWQVPAPRTYLSEAVWLLQVLLAERARTIAFARARQVVERMLRRVQQTAPEPLGQQIMAYRGGYCQPSAGLLKRPCFPEDCWEWWPPTP